ncbi:MAG: hypothetical protein R2762_18015 [Bryobacteraceae bacterium]
MSRKLILLNLMLAALLAAAGWQIRERWADAWKRAEDARKVRVRTPPTPEVGKFEGVPPVQAASYAEVASKMLFSRDRNPTVVIEEAPVVEDPVPPFPVAYGVLAFGDTTTAFLSEKAGSPQKGYRVNDQVGPFKLASLSQEEIILEWKDKRFVKAIAELKPKADEPPPAEAPSTDPARKVNEGTGTVIIDHPQTKEKEIAELQKKESGGNPWVNVGGTNHACAPGDTNPAGTVMNGYRKVTRPSMFGQSCFWEPVR